MNINVVQRFPNSFSGFTSEKVNISSLKEFLQIKFVNRWLNNPNVIHLTIDRTNRPQKLLMAECKDGSRWAIAFLKGDMHELEFPILAIKISKYDRIKNWCLKLWRRI